MPKLLLIGVTSKIAERFVEAVGDAYELFGTYHGSSVDYEQKCTYLPLDLGDSESVARFVSLVREHSFAGVLFFSSTYSKDSQNLEEYLSIADKDVRINALSPIAISRELQYDVGATVFFFGDAGLQVPKPHFTAYSVSKSLLQGLVKYLAVELQDRARVVTFLLGPTLAPKDSDHKHDYYARTSYRVDEPADGLVRYIQFLLEESNLGMTGTEITYDGGAYVKR